MERKSSQVKIRTTGDLPDIPGEITKAYPSLNNWWDDSVAVIDRLRDINGGSGQTPSQLSASNIKTLYEANPNTNEFSDYLKNRLENLEDALGIVGKAVGTETKQELNNKTSDGGFF